MKKISLVCVTYSRREFLDRCLESCVEQDYPNIEIVVVVNPSGDGTEQMLAEKYPQVKEVNIHQNIGFFPALNIALANSSGEYIMTVDDDAYFQSSDAISSLASYLDTHADVWAVSSNIEGPFESTIKEDEKDIAVFKTGFAMLRREVFFEWIGFYPDAFFRSAGENYVCKKIWDLDKRVVQLGKVMMYHDQTPTGRSDADWKFYGIRSQVLCSIMRDPPVLLPVLTVSKFVKSFFLFIKWRHAITWVRAWWSIALHFGYALKLRDSVSMATWRKLKALEKI